MSLHSAIDAFSFAGPPGTPFIVNLVLHRGALRYFREKGVNVPAALVPPEAK